MKILENPTKRKADFKDHKSRICGNPMDETVAEGFLPVHMLRQRLDVKCWKRSVSDKSKKWQLVAIYNNSGVSDCSFSF